MKLTTGPQAHLPSSGGFEGMAINRSGTKLYTLLERTVTGDAVGALRIDEFDIASEAYTGRRFIYPLDAKGTNIGDMAAIDDRRFLVLERSGGTATTPATAPFKKLYLVDIEDVAEGGVARKLELVDLMNLADPHDLNGDGSPVFTFPYGGGRELASDNTEFLRIRLPVSLIPEGREHRHDHDRDED